MKEFIKKFWIEILIILVLIYVVVDYFIVQELHGSVLYPGSLGIISLLLVSVRTRVLLEDYKEKVRGRVFTEYHKLIRVMNGVEDHFNDDDKTPAREVQCAAIFELRNYPEYKEFTYRTLKRWLEKEEEKWDKSISKAMPDILEIIKKQGKEIPENIKDILNPVLTEFKKKKSDRYIKEIQETLIALGFDEEGK